MEWNGMKLYSCSSLPTIKCLFRMIELVLLLEGNSSRYKFFKLPRLSTTPRTSKTMGRGSGELNSEMYSCLQLKSSGIIKDSANSIAGEIEAYLRVTGIEGTVPPSTLW
jgi:hypothetical protein